VGDLGTGAGEGYTVNLPVPAGSGDLLYRSLVDNLVAPLAAAFEPQLLLVSAGFDAHFEDPLASCQVTEAGFAAMARSVSRIGRSLDIPVGAVLEGGYALEALARSVAATLEGLAGPPSPELDAVPSATAALEARARLAPWWPALAGG
jgi:acetoin utilization deacetylase AcuC-like enzyme